MHPLVIVGGGISGLSTAYYLTKLSKVYNKSIGKIILIESSNRLGGWVDTIKNPKNGTLHELGPRSIRKGGESGLNTLKLIDELGIENQMLVKSSTDPKVGNRYIATSTELAKLPNKFLNIFFKQKPFSKPLYSYLLNEFRTPKLDLTNQSLDYLGNEKKIIEKNVDLLDEQQFEDISIYKFAKLRFGDDFADFMIDPLLRGINSGDARTLSTRSMFGEMFEFERKANSIIKGMFNKTRIESKNLRNQSPNINLSEKLNKIDGRCICSFQNGMVQLPNAIIDQLSNDSNVELRKDNELISFKIDAMDGKLNLEINEKNAEEKSYQLKAEHVFFSLNSIKLQNLIPENDEKLKILKSTLGSIKSASVATINLEFDKKDLVNNIPGFGFLIPSHVNSSILGVIFDSLVFPELNNLNKITRLSVMAGGDWFNELCKQDGELDESKLIEKSMQVLRKYLKINDDPSFIKVNVLKNCIPQYRVGHYLKTKLLQKQIDEKNLKLSFIGSSYLGISLNDCIYNSKKEVDNYLDKI